MIRIHWMQSASAAKAYYRASDYLSTTPGEWLGKGASMLGLTGTTSPEQFDSLADNLDPRTGLPLTTYTKAGRRVGLDMTFNSTKSVGIARELAGPDNAGDPRIEEAHREAVTYTVGLVEKDMQARVRVGGANDNRTTGNLVAYRVTHRDTRISAEDSRPDMSLHDHVFIFNATYDPVEQKWKAAEIGQIKHDAPYYEAVYHNRLATNLRDLGYGIRRDGKAFEVAGVSRELIDKFSRRRQYIKAVAAKLGITSPESMSKLGATTRLGKAKELADDLNGYYVSRLTEQEKQQLGKLQGQPSYLSSEQAAMQFAIGHEFERRSVVEERKLYETALRHGIGSVTPEGVETEAKKQGVLLKDGEATTKEVLAEEGRIIAFAREGKGTCRPMGGAGGGIEPRQQQPGSLATVQHHARPSDAHTAIPEGLSQEKGRPDESRRPPGNPVETAADGHTATPSPGAQAVSPASDMSPKSTSGTSLSPDQLAVVRHIWSSTDRVIMIEGDAGTGKTQTMQRTIPGIDRPGVFLAPSASASRGTLREKGFTNADTIARFLVDQKFREQARGGFIYIDEAPLAGIKDIDRVFQHAKELNARVILQGDRKQHRSVSRGDLFHILDKYAGVPVGRLTQNWRQQAKDYKAAVNALAKGDLAGGFDKLDALGWVGGDHRQLVNDYLAARGSVLVVAPTHAEGDQITAAIRERLKHEGRLGEERQFDQLVPLNWTGAQKGDLEQYTGAEVLQYYRNTGSFKAGDRVKVTGWKPGQKMGKPEHFAVFAPAKLELAVGDQIRTTANVKDTEGRRIDNDTALTVTGFNDGIEVRTATGQERVLPENTGHLAHGYVSTSHASQGKTVDHVLIAMGEQSLPAMNAEQFYVSASRGRESAKVYTDMQKDDLREAIQKKDGRKSATELMNGAKPKGKTKPRGPWLLKRARDIYRRLRSKMEQSIHERPTERRYEAYSR